MKAVTTALKQSRDTIVIKKHLKILEEFFCPVDEYWQQFVEEKIFDAFINIFQNGNEAAIVGVSRQLTPFVSYEPKRQEAAGKSGIAEAISEALEKHKSFKVLRDLCALLFYWPGMKGISEDSRAKIITTIAQTGMKHMEIIEKEAAAVDILSGIASVISYDRDYDEKESEEVVKNQEIAFKSGVLDLALALMEKSEDLLVFDYGGRIFGRICTDEERKDQAMKIKAIDLFAKGMKRAEDDQSEVLEHITFALMKIAGENEARIKLLKEAQVTPEQLRKTENYYGLHQDQQHLEGLENLAKQLEALGWEWDFWVSLFLPDLYWFGPSKESKNKRNLPATKSTFQSHDATLGPGSKWVVVGHHFNLFRGML